MNPKVLACLCLLFTNATFADCAQDADKLGAQYLLRTTDTASGDARAQDLVVWRNGSRVAHVHPDSGVVELWELTPNGRMRLVRFFDEYSRGIEYQPGEVDIAADKGGWQKKWQLVSDARLQSLGEPVASGQGCDRVASYRWQEQEVQYELDWLPGLQLISHYRAITPDHETEWKLERTVTDGDEIDQAFARRDAYQTTDYADIGDHESDPFLLKMINLGFIGPSHGPHQDH
jgi:hypothetical protein